MTAFQRNGHPSVEELRLGAAPAAFGTYPCFLGCAGSSLHGIMLPATAMVVGAANVTPELIGRSMWEFPLPLRYIIALGGALVVDNRALSLFILAGPGAGNPGTLRHVSAQLTYAQDAGKGGDNYVFRRVEENLWESILLPVEMHAIPVDSALCP